MVVPDLFNQGTAPLLHSLGTGTSAALIGHRHLCCTHWVQSPLLHSLGTGSYSLLGISSHYKRVWKKGGPVHTSNHSGMVCFSIFEPPPEFH